LICCKAIGCQRNLFLTLGFYNHLQHKHSPFLV
jgi:hypothetical protein